MLGRKWTPASGEDHDNHDTQAVLYTPVMMVFLRGPQMEMPVPLWWWLSGDSRKTALCSTEICTWLTLDAQPLLAFLISLMDIF